MSRFEPCTQSRQLRRGSVKMPKPIHIMHVVDNLGLGGLENALVNLIGGMNRDRFEHTVYVLRHLGVNADRLARLHVPVMCLGKEAGSSIQLPALARAIRKVQPDVVHSRNWGAV